MERKRWWQSKKVWGTIIGALLMGFGEKWGMDPEAASNAAYMFLGGVSVEGIIDAASAFGRAWRGN